MKDFLKNTLLIINKNYFKYINKCLFLFLGCYIKRLLFVQLNFQLQKCEIGESLYNSAKVQHYIILYYPKYNCELNYIKNFYYSTQQYTRFQGKYFLNEL